MLALFRVAFEILTAALAVACEFRARMKLIQTVVSHFTSLGTVVCFVCGSFRGFSSVTSYPCAAIIPNTPPAGYT